MALFAAHGVALSLSPWCRVASREPWSAFHPACFLCLPGRASLSPVAKPARRPGALDNPVWCVPAGGPRRHRTQVPTLAAPQGAAAGGRDGSPATAYPSWCSPSYRRWRRQRGGRPERAKTYGKKREHGLDSGDSGLTTGAYVLSPAQGGGLLRAIIACNPHWLACCRGGRRIARNKPGGANAGDHIACNTSNASDTGRREQPTVAAAVPRQSGARGPVSGHAAWLRVRPAPLPALAPGTAGRGGKPKPPKIPSLVSAWPLRQFSSSGSRWSVGPKSPEAVGCQFGVPGGVLDVAMAQIMLDRARILAVVGELIASRMAQHVRVDREVDTGLASWGGRPNGVILHGSGIGRNVEGRVSGGLPAPGWRGTPSPSPPRQRHHLTPLVLHAMSSPALAPRFAACNTPPQKGHRVQL